MRSSTYPFPFCLSRRFHGRSFGRLCGHSSSYNLRRLLHCVTQETETAVGTDLHFLSPSIMSLDKVVSLPEEAFCAGPRWRGGRGRGIPTVSCIFLPRGAQGLGSAVGRPGIRKTAWQHSRSAVGADGVYFVFPTTTIGRNAYELVPIQSPCIWSSVSIRIDAFLAICDSSICQCETYTDGVAILSPKSVKQCS